MKSSEIPSLSNVIRLQSCSNTASIGPKCIKLEPKNGPVLIPIQTAQAITVTNGPIIALPLATTPSVTTSSNKRPRPDSPDENSQTKTISLEQLKRQYGHMSVSHSIELIHWMIGIFRKKL